MARGHWQLLILMLISAYCIWNADKLAFARRMQVGLTDAQQLTGARFNRYGGLAAGLFLAAMLSGSFAWFVALAQTLAVSILWAARPIAQRMALESPNAERTKRSSLLFMGLLALVLEAFVAYWVLAYG
jgi:hypothetical protein